MRTVNIHAATTPAVATGRRPPAAGQEIIIAKVGKRVADLGPLASPRGKLRLGTVDLGAHKLLRLRPSQHDELRPLSRLGTAGGVMHRRAADRHRGARDGTSTYVAEREF